MNKLPLKTYDLIDELNKIYPQVNPDFNTSDRQIMFMAGQRSVINYLLDLKTRELQNK